MSMKPRTRVLLANVGLDGHQMGALAVARGLRDAGFEVIYLGLNQMPRDVVAVAAQEEVDIIGISSMCGIHLEALSEIVGLLKKRDMQNIKLIAGGIIPGEDVPALKQAGVAEVFRPGTPIKDIVASLEEH